MTNSKMQQVQELAADQRRRCSAWLLTFMRDDHPKFLTKSELRVAAMHELGVSKGAFDFGWIDAIETSGRHDWYEPLRGRPRAKS